ncbi:dihydroxyacetone kinase subunit DhaK [Mycetocola reblochoni]|uniref:Phosphoenolpyruvate-dihydroxyacetone phosphotransferase, dihydroxyacetone binding subunit DhaK n=3 Tax=Mycetocola reblochoni TaxID=331618 RepID=A0A1R4J6J3_9MICO|nr:dihydroxyacetone kinase subunit DhaK [Mycetocola reblochoni]RLP69599.1 dihydroxyacetone kinase subunit DhaK [Mycetocola reblochoni]SJN27544.1 Phosphoenolpyruvate-dihydroxyacetone phosphotransferase, dihydroxyacetone binding subunit DhaK [Mycetocola reblochoni REB411]
MKKLINDPHNVVAESIAGFLRAESGRVARVGDTLAVRRVDAPVQGKVALLSGGGSGHEPLHAGFVGRGMLDAAVPGPVFTSPTPDPIVAAAQSVDSGRGVLFIVKNYTGDVLNFETAAELAELEGVTVESVLVDDDVAVRDSLYTAGRRGVAGTLLVEKIAGAAAERGDDLEAVASVARTVVSRVRSMGVALSACTVPHAGVPSFDLADDEIEIGIGIHGEPGRARIPAEDADHIAARLLAPILEDLEVAKGERVLVLVNGMGGTPLSELHLLFGSVAALLDERGIIIDRSLVGNYVTALEMQGASVTILHLDPELTELWDAPVDTPALVRRGPHGE